MFKVLEDTKARFVRSVVSIVKKELKFVDWMECANQTYCFNARSNEKLCTFVTKAYYRQHYGMNLVRRYFHFGWQFKNVHMKTHVNSNSGAIVCNQKFVCASKLRTVKRKFYWCELFILHCNQFPWHLTCWGYEPWLHANKFSMLSRKAPKSLIPNTKWLFDTFTQKP